MIKDAPFSFVSCVLILTTLLCGGIFAALEWHYSGVIEEKNATIERTANDRDTYKADWDESQQENVKLRASIPSGFVTQIVQTVSSITNIDIVTQMVSSVGPIEDSR